MKRGWEAARKAHDQSRKEKKPATDGSTVPLHTPGQDPLPVVGYSPLAIAGNFTIEKLLFRLAHGRVTQMSMASEATALINNYSFRPGNRSLALSKLCELFDSDLSTIERVHMVEDIRLEGGGYRFGLCWAAQPDKTRALAFSDDAADGFVARCLVSIDDSVPEAVVPGSPATYALDRMQGIIKMYRQQQDRGAEFDRPGRVDIPVLSPTPPAVEKLRTFTHVCHAYRKQAKSRHAGGFWGRAAEHSFRLAANFRAIRLYRGEAADTEWDLDELVQAMAMVEWHGSQMEAQADSEHATDWSKAAAAATVALPQAVHWTSSQQRASGRPADGVTVILRTWLKQTHPHGTGLLRQNPDALEWAVKAMASHGWIAPLVRGRYAVNPSILGA